MKNRIINGAMVVSQYNGTSSVTPTADGYGLDRWKYLMTNASKFSVQQNAGSVTPPAGFSNYLGITSLAATSLGATDYYLLGQFIEGFNTADLGFGTANAKTVTLSFQVYSSLTGTFGGVLQNSAINRSYPFTYSVPVANTWTTINITVAGDTSGTWVGATNGIGLRVYFSLGTGSTYSGTAGAWASGFYSSATGATSVVGTNGATFYITGVQLEVGSSATGFEYVNYQTSLANCQRYYSTGRVIARTSFYNVAQSGFDSFEATGFHKVTMRSTPTIATTNNTSGTITVPTITNEIASIQKVGVFGTNLDVSYTASAEL
jgi:hypothetical protein